MRKLFFATIMIACATAFTFAQGSDDYNKYDVYVGYSHARVDLGGDREGFNGVEGAVTGNISRYVGLKGDYAFHFKSFGTSPFNVDAKTHTLVGGLQIKDNSTETRLKPFLHVMAGFANARATASGFSDSSTGFAGIIGGGLDIRAGKRVDVRVVQLDYNPTRIEGEWQHNFRIGAGIVFR
jgi:hypothetical protein